MTISQRIRDLREDKDLNQTQIATLLNTSQTVYSRYERNERDLPIDYLITLLNFITFQQIIYLVYPIYHIQKDKKITQLHNNKNLIV